MKRRWAFPVLAVMTATAAPGRACQLDDPLEIFSSTIIERGEIRAVALARVAEVEVIPGPPDQPNSFLANWRASFDVEQVIRGNPKSRHFTRQQLSGPGPCELSAAPHVGDLRVLYIFDKDVVFDVDSVMARRLEPLLETRLPPKLRD